MLGLYGSVKYLPCFFLGTFHKPVHFIPGGISSSYDYMKPFLHALL